MCLGVGAGRCGLCVCGRGGFIVSQTTSRKASLLQNKGVNRSLSFYFGLCGFICGSDPPSLTMVHIRFLARAYLPPHSSPSSLLLIFLSFSFI